MESITSLALFVAKPANFSYGDAMSRVRMWLDHEKMQVTHFKLAPQGQTGFEIGFRSDADRIRFGSGFAWVG